MNNPATSEPFTTEDVDRLLGLADQFLEDWESQDGKPSSECAECRLEYDALRPLLVAAPTMLELLSWHYRNMPYEMPGLQAAGIRKELRTLFDSLGVQP